MNTTLHTQWSLIAMNTNRPSVQISEHCLEGHVLLPGLTLVKHSFTYVLLKFYALGNSSTSCSKLSRWTTFISMFYSWFTHCAQQGKTTGKTSVHLAHHAVKHRGVALIGYTIYLCFTNGVKTYSTMGSTTTLVKHSSQLSTI